MLALFNSLGSPSPPPSQAAAQVFENESTAEGESEPPLQHLDHLVPHLSRIDLNDDKTGHGGQQGAVHVDHAASDAPAGAAVASSPSAAGLMSAAAAGDRACIREWMQVEQTTR